MYHQDLWDVFQMKSNILYPSQLILLQNLGNEPRSMHDMMQVVRKVSYLGVAMLKEEDTPTSADQVLAGNSKSNNSESKRKWTLQEPPFPPLTHCSNARFDVKALSNITNSTD